MPRAKRVSMPFGDKRCWRPRSKNFCSKEDASMPNEIEKSETDDAAVKLLTQKLTAKIVAGEDVDGNVAVAFAVLKATPLLRAIANERTAIAESTDILGHSHVNATLEKIARILEKAFKVHH
jgi:hypothetical protein